MTIKMNETRKAVIDALKGANEALTLAEISEIAGVEVKTGTTNAMVSAGIIRKVGTKKVAKVVYVEVATYEMGDESALESEKESK